MTSSDGWVCYGTQSRWAITAVPRALEMRSSSQPCRVNHLFPYLRISLTPRTSSACPQADSCAKYCLPESVLHHGHHRGEAFAIAGARGDTGVPWERAGRGHRASESNAGRAPPAIRPQGKVFAPDAPGFQKPAARARAAALATPRRRSPSHAGGAGHRRAPSGAAAAEAPATPSAEPAPGPPCGRRKANCDRTGRRRQLPGRRAPPRLARKALMRRPSGCRLPAAVGRNSCMDTLQRSSHNL